MRSVDIETGSHIYSEPEFRCRFLNESHQFLTDVPKIISKIADFHKSSKWWNVQTRLDTLEPLNKISFLCIMLAFGCHGWGMKTGWRKLKDQETILTRKKNNYLSWKSANCRNENSIDCHWWENLKLKLRN